VAHITEPATGQIQVKNENKIQIFIQGKGEEL